MLEIRGVRIVGMGLEHPAFGTAIHRYEPGSVSELRRPARHRCDSCAIPAALVDELDRSQHVDLSGDTIPAALDGDGA
jgi:hypothetical protein